MSKKFYIAISLLAITAGIGAIFIENMSIEMVTPIITGILGLIYGVYNKFEFEDVKSDLIISKLETEDYRGYLQTERRNSTLEIMRLRDIQTELLEKLDKAEIKPTPKKRNKKTDK